MATQTPRRDNLHGEEDTTPRFTGEHSPLGYDDQAGSSSYNPQETPLMDKSDPRGGVNRGDLGRKEGEAGDGSSTAMDDSEKSLSDKLTGSDKRSSGGGFYRQESTRGRTKLRGRLSKFTRRRIAIIATTGLVAGGGIFSLSLIQGPFQFVHMAQLLQKHFSFNQEFGNDRTSKVLLYALAGQGAQKGRLGIVGNYSANKWEARLLDKTGLRPVYQDPGRRFVGLQIVNDNKAQTFLGDIDGKNSAKIEKTMGKGAEIQPAGSRTTIVDGNGNPLSRDDRFVDLTKGSFGDRRIWIRSVLRSTDMNFVSASMAGRLLIKRAGVNFHPLNKLKGKVDAAAARRIENKRNKNISEPAKSTENVKADPTQDTNGDETADSASDDDIKTSQETKSAIDEFKSSGAIDKFKSSGALKTAYGATVIVGVMCAAKTYGEGVEEYKFQNNALPMMRMGMDIITTGNQVMSGDDIDLASLGVMTKYMYDKENKTSWTQAESIRANQGKKGGIPIAKEADLRNAGEKPAFFNALDSISILTATCNAVEGFMGLPIIRHVSQAVSGLTDAALNAALSVPGTSTDELLQASFKAVSGKSVDPESKGADFGNLADTGAFLASNDQAIASGGRLLEPDESQALAALEEEYDKQDRSSRSFFATAFDIYDKDSLVSSIIDQGPSNPSQLANMFSNPINLIGSSFSGIFSRFTPSASAQSTVFDYGVPKAGFPIGDQESADFEDPYVNAGIVEPQLDSLNDKYGKCFGMNITSSGIESADKSVNVFNLQKGKDGLKVCRENKNDLMFKRFQFYIADLVTATGLACFYGDKEACEQIGMESDSESSDSGTTETAGAKIDIAKLKEPSDKIDCAPNTKDAGVIDGYTGGTKVRIRLCEIPNLPQPTGYGSKNGHATVNSRVSGAVYAMMEAAKKDGVEMSASSSSRTMQDQESLCPCDGVSVGRPGYSNHQLGVAIDFGGGGQLMDQGNPMWKWLNSNADKFDYKPYSAEAWHWSPFGS